jgi:hypothetical protein
MKLPNIGTLEMRGSSSRWGAFLMPFVDTLCGAPVVLNEGGAGPYSTAKQESDHEK